jgi:hypothetical protein
MLFSPCTLIRPTPARSPAARQRVKFLLFAIFPLHYELAREFDQALTALFTHLHNGQSEVEPS